MNRVAMMAGIEAMHKLAAWVYMLRLTSYHHCQNPNLPTIEIQH